MGHAIDAFRRTLVLVLPLFAIAPAAAQELVSGGVEDGALAFDAHRQRLIMTTADGAILEHDGTHWGEVGRLPATSPRVSLGTYDPIGRRTLFAGARLLAYDGSDVVDHGTSPAIRHMTMDTQRRVLVALGGVPTGIHEWNGRTWGFRTSLSGVPWSIAYDVGRQVCVLTVANVSPQLGFDTYEWDGTSLALRATEGRTFREVSYDQARNVVISNTNQGTDRWTGSAWTSLGTPAAPWPGRYATDPAGVWMFTKSTNQRGLWFWDGIAWTRSRSLPHPFVVGTISYDSSRDVTVLLALRGNRSEHHEWDGTRWKPFAGPLPPPRHGHAQVFDAARGETIVFGGESDQHVVLGDTWRFDGQTWRAAGGQGPAARKRAAIAFDSRRGRVHLIGGESGGVSFADHWEWDGTSWSLAAAPLPMTRFDSVALGHDPVRDRLVLIDALRQTWEFDGFSWTMVHPRTPFSSISDQRMVWNAARQRLQIGSDHRYEWDGTQWQRLQADEEGSLAFDSRRAVMLSYQTFAMRSDTTRAASVTQIGTPCGPGVPTRTLRPFGLPRIGSRHFSVDLRSPTPRIPVVVLLGAGNAGPVFGNGCRLQMQRTYGYLLGFTDSRGFHHQVLPIPDDLAFRGLRLAAQGVELNMNLPGGFALTDGLQLVIGD